MLSSLGCAQWNGTYVWKTDPLCPLVLRFFQASSLSHSLTTAVVASNRSGDRLGQRDGGSIRSKMVLSLAIMFMVFLAINEVVQWRVIFPGFADDSQAGEVLWQAKRSFLLLSVAALLFQMLMIQRIVIEPISRLKQHISNTRMDSETRQRQTPTFLCGNQIRDEICDLADTFDQTFDRLITARQELSRASQASGRSEVAATVIHNVGNVLTNVNSLVDTASNRVDQLRVEPLHQLADRLKQFQDDTELLEATPEYLHRLASRLERDQAEIAGLLESLDGNLCHIHDVIRDQRRHTSQKDKLVPVNIKDLVMEAIVCCHARLKDDSVDVVVLGDEQGHVPMDRSLGLQMVINIIANAGYATRIHRDDHRRLKISMESTPSSVAVHFCDNGCGMDEDTLDQVFNAHFTRRENGSGLGLHFCAITASRFGGSITAHSDGLGQGSTLSLHLPVSETTVGGTATRGTATGATHASDEGSNARRTNHWEETTS